MTTLRFDMADYRNKLKERQKAYKRELILRIIKFGLAAIFVSGLMFTYILIAVALK